MQERRWTPFCRILIRIGQMTLNAKDNDPFIKDNLVIISQIHYKVLHRQSKFSRIRIQSGHNDPQGQGEWPIFSKPADSIPECMLCETFLYQFKSVLSEVSCRQVEFVIILSQSAQIDMGNQSQWPRFSIPAESIQGCMFGSKFGDFQLKSVTSYLAAKIEFTDGRTSL